MACSGLAVQTGRAGETVVPRKPLIILDFVVTSLYLVWYQSAVIKESLRLAHGVVSPMPRVVGPDDAFISGYHVPAKVRHP